jgi:hypothetical protein
LNFRQDIKKWFVQSFWRIFSKNPAGVQPCRSPHLVFFYCYYRPPDGGRSPARPRSAVRCGASKYSNQFPVPGRAESGGWWVLSRARPLLFLSGQLALHRSRKLPKTIALYYTPSKYWGR